MIIDDSAGILFVMQQALEMKDYAVVTSDTFLGADVVEAEAPHLIFLDISLLGADGREVAQTLKGDPRTAHIPIVILTAHPHADALAEEAGADDYLPKPFELANLWKVAAKYTKSA